MGWAAVSTAPAAGTSAAPRAPSTAVASAIVATAVMTSAATGTTGRTTATTRCRGATRRPAACARGMTAGRPCVTGWAPGGRTWPGWRTMCPAVLVAIKRPAAIIVTPVGPDREADNRQADRRPVRQHGHIAALIGITQVTGIDPAAQIGQRDVTPCVTADATHHGNGYPGCDLRHERIVACRPRTKVDRPARECLLLRERDARQSRQAQEPRTNPSNELSSHDVSDRPGSRPVRRRACPRHVVKETACPHLQE
jgi:hypothetical protein